MARSQSDESYLQEIFPIYFPKDIFTMKSDKITAIKAFSTFFSKSGFKLLKNVLIFYKIYLKSNRLHGK